MTSGAKVIDGILQEAAERCRDSAKEWRKNFDSQIIDFTEALHKAYAAWAPLVAHRAALLEELKRQYIRPPERFEFDSNEATTWDDVLANIVHQTLWQELARRHPDLARVNSTL